LNDRSVFSRQRIGGRGLVTTLLVVLLFATELGAQGQLPPAMGTPGVAGEVRTVAGRVLRGAPSSAQPVEGQVVVLHRISADSSGPVDSVRTSATGGYRFRYTLDSPRSMYIVSARYSGVAYFTTPLRERNVEGPDADVAVYDTTSAGFPLTVRARHIVIAPPQAGGLRQVVDVYEVANDSNRTLVTGAAGATWRLTLPDEARDPASTGGDLPGESFRFADGRAELLVPFPPGSRQLVLTYSIPVESSVAIPVHDPVASLEVLLEGAGSEVKGAGLVAEAPVSMEGRTFQRYRAADVATGASFSVETAGTPGSGRLALLVVAAIAVTLGVILARRAPAAAVAVATPSRSPSEALAREIAALDHVYSADAPRAGGGSEFYRNRRAELMNQLVAAQAVEDPGPAT
jgi:hypothetical protein